MEQTLNILIPYGYRDPTEGDARKGKNYVLSRERAVVAISSFIDALLEDAAEEIIRVCYRYNVDPLTFHLSSKYNENLFDEIADILDKLEEDIMELVLDYATRFTKDEKRKASLLPWIALLGRGNNNLMDTLEKRLWFFSRDIEAAVVAMRMAKYDVTKAVSRIKSNLKALYVMPEMRAVFANATKFMATYIRTKGVKHGNVGSSNSEANNIDRFAKTTVQMAWMKNLMKEYEEEGAAGYIVSRGSDYPCDLCDSHTGWHPIEDTQHFPPFHPSCVCWTMPLFKTV